MFVVKANQLWLRFGLHHPSITPDLHYIKQTVLHFSEWIKTTYCVYIAVTDPSRGVLTDSGKRWKYWDVTVHAEGTHIRLRHRSSLFSRLMVNGLHFESCFSFDNHSKHYVHTTHVCTYHTSILRALFYSHVTHWLCSHQGQCRVQCLARGHRPRDWTTDLLIGGRPAPNQVIQGA